jgi:hypothetical protein
MGNGQRELQSPKFEFPAASLTAKDNIDACEN